MLFCNTCSNDCWYFLFGLSLRNFSYYFGFNILIFIYYLISDLPFLYVIESSYQLVK